MKYYTLLIKISTHKSSFLNQHNKDINKTVGSWGIHEQWIYSSHFLYFENGILTSWQD